jgi:hypothetical protein
MVRPRRELLVRIAVCSTGWRAAFPAPHRGHAGASLSLRTKASNVCPQAEQQKSKIRMSVKPESP